MLCEKCKMREANIVFTEIVNGTKNEHYYCSQCAQEMGFDLSGITVEGEFPLAKLLSSLLAQTAIGKADNEYAGVVCPSCGTTYQEFISESKFGCPDCYKVFGLLIDENIKNLQGSDTHKGKKPKYMSDELTESVKEDLADRIKEPQTEINAKDKIILLKRSLKIAIEQEEYEEAARIRDEIKSLEGGAADA